MSYGYQDRLEGAFRMGRLRRVRMYIFMALAVLTAALCAIQVASLYPSLRPFYLPIQTVIPTTIVMAFVAFVVWIYFRYLEIKNMKNDGQRYRMVQNSMRQAIVLIVSLGVATAILGLPWVHGGIAGGMSETLGRTLTRNAVYTVEGGVASVDVLGFSRVTAVSVFTMSGTVNVMVAKYGEGSLPVGVPQGRTWRVALDTTTRILYNVTVTNTQVAVAQFTLTIERDLFPEAFSVVPFALGLFVATNVGWYSGLRPLEERFRSGSIFSKERKEKIPAGERVFTANRDSKTFLDLPPPPPDLPAAGTTPGPVVLLRVSPTETIPPPPPGIPVARAPTARVSEPTVEEAADLAAMGSLEEALARYDQVLRRNPGLARAALGKAEVLVRLGRRPAALGVYRQILRDDKGNPEALQGCLAIHEADRAWRSALDVSDQIVALRPDDADAHAKRGDILTILRRTNDAKAAYEKAVALRPDDTDLQERLRRHLVDIPLLVSKAFVASAAGRYQDAVDVFDQVLRVEPDNLNLQVGKSGALRRLGRTDDARAILDEVLDRNPVHSAALLTKAQLLSETGDLSGALAALDALLAVHVGDSDALLERGDVLMRMGRTADAQASYEAALKLNPDDLDASEKLKAIVEGEASQRAVLRELFRIRGLGPVKAKALIDAGFRSVDDLRRATPEALARVVGITPKIAEDIAKHFRG